MKQAKGVSREQLQLLSGGGRREVPEIVLSSVCIDPVLLLQWRLVTSFSHLFLQCPISHITEDYKRRVVIV